MNNQPGRQKGASNIATIITLAIIAYAGYVGFQYFPQFIESKTVSSILDKMRDTQVTDPVRTVADANMKVIKMLQINEMDDMEKNLSVDKENDRIKITISYNRELNLGYKMQPMYYEKSVHLK